MGKGNWEYVAQKKNDYKGDFYCYNFYCFLIWSFLLFHIILFESNIGSDVCLSLPFALFHVLLDHAKVLII